MSEQRLQLISHDLCPYVQRAMITLTEKGVGHECIYIDLANKPDWFRAISPLGRVPVLRVGDAVLFESAVICEYLEETTPGRMHPEDPVARAVHRAWIEHASATLAAIAGLYGAPDAEAHGARRRTLQERLAWLERQLGEGPYFAGEPFHLVDAAWAPVFRYLDTFEAIGEPALLDGLERVTTYRRALAARPSVRTAVPEGYPERLRLFLARRESPLGALARAAA
ncbi:glutathione S-transferase family protein [Spiribacter halobius]|uniref:glutathione transferase n=1 Tax=Sediminicurvatus halobius TaxID=2182432 RepID=A0A2U2MX44_9GAMM|nr:glutathione S-transferase family protein [Spiribacter halobius]PWG61366.1 glutathione S-transferase family protein [Spiribacter halobius]UEX76581.1 glutathione S-transferase family protein [Spiribacter halobius]